MKMTFKSKLAVLSIAFLTTLAFTGCKTHGDGAASGIHSMGTQKSGYMMHNADMPTR